MIEQAGGPRWRLLYAVIAVILGLLFLDARASLLPAGHEILELGIVLVGFGLIELWIRGNALSLAGEHRGTGLRQAAPASASHAATVQGVLLIEEGPHYTPIRHARDGDEAGLPEQTPISLN